MSSSNLRARQTVLGIVALSLFAALFTRLWYLQVLTTDEYEVAAEAVRTEEVILEAPRGRILDRQGKVLVENVRTIQVAVDWQDFTDLSAPEQGELLRHLSREITLDEQLRHQGLRLGCDPGGGGPDAEAGEATTTTAPDDNETTTTTTTTTVPVDPNDPNGANALDETAPGGVQQGTDSPCDNRPPPAGVATGARNPDGEQDVEAEPPAPVTEAILRERIDDPRFSKFKPVPVATGVSEDLEARITENPERFTTVTVERTTVRKYNYGALAAHVLGYVGSITEDELEEYQNPDKPYENDDEIGKAGIERGMEEELRGTPGRRVYEVDARNRPIREIESDYRAPVPGRDVYLTIDINMQYLTEMGLADVVSQRTGRVEAGCVEVEGEESEGCQPQGAASVAIDPRNGQVLTMASYPTYDPNLFVGGISTRDYEAIAADRNKDQHNNPLLNRVIRGEFAPGSTFKLFSAFAGLANGLINPGDYYNDTGVYLYDPNCPSTSTVRCSAQNAGAKPNGPVNLTDALRVSSDTYFYKLGHESWRDADRIGEDAMQVQMETWGLGAPTGIDLPGEAPGRIPTPEWLMEFSRDVNGRAGMSEDEIIDRGTWRPGTSGNTMVGQGDVLVTPLQLALGYATLANGGTIWKPQLVLQVTDYAARTNAVVIPAEQTGQVDLRPEWRDPMIEGFDQVTKSGTASTGFQGVDQSVCPVAGKTGTAQVTGKNDSSLFAAFAPTPTEGRTSTIAMATVFDQAGFGAAAAVPLTRRVLEPFASYGCDIAAFGEKGNQELGIRASAYTAPLGGWFDVTLADRRFVPPVAESSD